MIINKTGFVSSGLYVTGFAWSPAYLLVSKTPLVFEAGFSCMAKLYEKDIRNILVERSPEYLFLTHVHYDHCGAAAYLKKAFPNLRICASRRAREIIQRQNAVNLMASLSGYVIPLIAELPDIRTEELLTESFQPFDIDIILENEQALRIDQDLSVQIMMTPGHTRDMLSYYIPERKILIATESAGCLGRNGRIVSEFLVDYDSYIASMKRFLALDVDVFCQGHHFVFTGADVGTFLTNSLHAAESFKTRVIELLHREKGSVDRVAQIIKSEEYDTNPLVKQPERAYLLNLKTQIGHLATRFAESW